MGVPGKVLFIKENMTVAEMDEDDMKKLDKKIFLVTEVKGRKGKKIVTLKSRAVKEIEDAWKKYHEGTTPKLSPSEEC